MTVNNFIRAVSRLTCGDDEERATAFLVSPNMAITATHAITNALEGGDITLEFLNLSKTPIIKKAKPIIFNDSQYNSPITILELEGSLDSACYLEFSNYELEGQDSCEIFGYPVTKWEVGSTLQATVTRRINDNMTKIFEWDLDLDHNSKIEEFGGLSGSPLILNGRVVGVILIESKENNKAISLGAISTESFKHVLERLQIPVFYEDEIDLFDDMYNLEDDINYADSMFIAKLESAGIYDHEMCQRDFYCAEIVKKQIEGKRIKSQINNFKKIKRDILSIWSTQYFSYSDETDGNALLAKVYMRVEDLSESTLKSDEIITLMAKKGMVHQLADDCKVGWIKNYKQKLQYYLERKVDEQ